MSHAGHHPPEGAGRGADAARAATPAARAIRHPRSGLTITMTEAAGRTRLAVHGEVDLDSAGTLGEALDECLASSVLGVDVDMTGTAFFDCAGLNVLLRAVRRARAMDAELAVTLVSPAVARVLDLTHCRHVFPGAAVQAGPPGGTASGSATRATHSR